MGSEIHHQSQRDATSFYFTIPWKKISPKNEYPFYVLNGTISYEIETQNACKVDAIVSQCIVSKDFLKNPHQYIIFDYKPISMRPSGNGRAEATLDGFIDHIIAFDAGTITSYALSLSESNSKAVSVDRAALQSSIIRTSTPESCGNIAYIQIPINPTTLLEPSIDSKK